MSVSILSERDFILAHGRAFYTQFPTEESIRTYIDGMITSKIESTPASKDPTVYEEGRESVIDLLTTHMYEDYGYLKFLKFLYKKKLHVDANSVYKGFMKQGKGIKYTSKSPKTGKPEFRNSGGDEGRRLINNLSYQEIASCEKDKPADILAWDAYNNAIAMKHVYRPAFFKNIEDGLFDGEDGQTKLFDMLTKFIGQFCSRASIFNPKIYATIMNQYAPFAESSLHLVGSWCTPALAAASLKNLKHQVIIDVIPRQKEVGEYINSLLPDSLINKRPKLDFIICPSEQLDNRLDFCDQYKDYFDIQIFSPVYYTSELYSTTSDDAGEQSVDSFPTYETWIEGYFHETIKTAFKVMKPGSKFIIVISDFEYRDKTTKKWYYISKDMLDITEHYFDHYETVDLILTTGTGFTSKKLKAKRRESRKNLFQEHAHVFTVPVIKDFTKLETPWQRGFHKTIGMIDKQEETVIPDGDDLEEDEV